MSLRVSDLKEHTNDPWGVSLPLPGADVVVSQTRESSISVGRGGVVLHGVARSKSTSVDRGGERHAGGEVVRSQRGHK